MYAVGINEMAQSVVEDVTNKVKERGFKSFKSYLRIDNNIKYDAVTSKTPKAL